MMRGGSARTLFKEEAALAQDQVGVITQEVERSFLSFEYFIVFDNIWKNCGTIGFEHFESK